MMTITDPAEAFVGRWRIVEMAPWSKGYLDLLEEAHLTFRGATAGSIAFGTLEGSISVTYVEHEQEVRALFTWEGQDGADDARGSGWATIASDGCLVGHFHIEDGGRFAFFCERD